MRVNHNWFALVTVELADRCQRGVCPLGEGDEEEEGGEVGEKSRMCLLMRLSETSHEALFPFLSRPRSSVCLVILVNEHSCSENVSIIHMTHHSHTHTHTHTYIKPL